MIPLTSPDSIGDSLSAISTNFYSIDNRTYYLNLSANQLFEPLEVFTNEKLSDFVSLISTTKNNSAKWVDLKTTVSMNSAAWIKPLVYVHNEILKDPVSITTFYTVTATFAKKYPIFINEYPEYVENQKAYIYYYSYESINRLNFVETKYSNLAYCVCPLSYNLVVYCNDSSGGSVSCDNGTFGCGGCATSCQTSQMINCYYENGSNAIHRYISANINAYFDDRYEKSLKCAIFQVKNCKWEFLRYL